MTSDPTRAPGARHARAIAGLHVAAMMFGLTGVIGAALAQDALTITLARTLVAGAALALLAAARGERLAPRRAYVANGALLALHWATFFAAVKAGGVAAGALGYASFPVFVVLAERWAMPRATSVASARGASPALDGRAWLTVLLATAGLAFTALGRGFGPAPRAGLALGVASGLAFAVLVVRNRRHVAAPTVGSRLRGNDEEGVGSRLRGNDEEGVGSRLRGNDDEGIGSRLRGNDEEGVGSRLRGNDGISAVSLALWQNVFAAAWLLLPWLAWMPSPRAALESIDLRAAALLLLLGIGCTALAHTLLIGAMRHVGARAASVIVALEPVYAIALSAWLLAQVPDVVTLCGAALVISAAIVASRRSFGAV